MVIDISAKFLSSNPRQGTGPRRGSIGFWPHKAVAVEEVDSNVRIWVCMQSVDLGHLTAHIIIVITEPKAKLISPMTVPTDRSSGLSFNAT
jgi:hypothetical protein